MPARLFNFVFDGPLRRQVEEWAAARGLSTSAALRVLIARGLHSDGQPTRPAPTRKD